MRLGSAFQHLTLDIRHRDDADENFVELLDDLGWRLRGREVPYHWSGLHIRAHRAVLPWWERRERSGAPCAGHSERDELVILGVADQSP